MKVEPGVVVGGKYVLKRAVGHGGMGSVWHAEHVTLGSPYAIKFLRPDLAFDESALARFEREARTTAQLQTHHAVRVHDHGVEGIHAYLVMDLLEGEDLNRRLKRVGRLGAVATCTVVEQVARGLHHAHSKGIVHRDLKPANIFLSLVDGAEVVKILDFGVAKMLDRPEGASTTQTGTLLGSPHYMSPEQIRGHWPQVDHRTDLWALAVIAYRGLTGQLPFLGDVIGDVMIKVCIDPIPPPSNIAPNLPPRLDDFFERALARDRDQRFRSAYELASELSRALNVPLQQPTAHWSVDEPPSVDHAAAPSPATITEAADSETVTLRRDDETACDSAGTLTEAGSLQIPASPSRARSPVPWAVGAAVAIVVTAAAVALRPSDRPLVLEASLAPTIDPPELVDGARDASPAAAPTEPSPSTSGPPEPTTSSAPPEPAPASKHAEPIAPKPTRRPPPPPQDEDRFRDRFGYD